MRIVVQYFSLLFFALGCTFSQQQQNDEIAEILIQSNQVLERLCIEKKNDLMIKSFENPERVKKFYNAFLSIESEIDALEKEITDHRGSISNKHKQQLLQMWENLKTFSDSTLKSFDVFCALEDYLFQPKHLSDSLLKLSLQQYIRILKNDVLDIVLRPVSFGILCNFGGDTLTVADISQLGSQSALLLESSTYSKFDNFIVEIESITRNGILDTFNYSFRDRHIFGEVYWDSLPPGRYKVHAKVTSFFESYKLIQEIDKEFDVE
ncbi:MAG: hypothetical protein JJU02_12730 [Cryomorphaceae bacterium]|nr:hypothetical protein [Cryomorphaceae bacterium]